MSEGLNAHRLFALRYEEGASHDELVGATIQELKRFHHSGRLPVSVLFEAMKEYLDVLEDKLLENCPSWADSIYTRWFPGVPTDTSRRVTTWDKGRPKPRKEKANHATQ